MTIIRMLLVSELLPLAAVVEVSPPVPVVVVVSAG
jgi:hypothetical protein